MGPPNHLDLVLPESGAVAQKGYQQYSRRNTPRKCDLIFVFKPRKPASGNSVDRCKQVIKFSKDFGIIN